MPNFDRTNVVDEMINGLDKESAYDFIRGSDRFSAVIAELEKYATELGK